MRRSTPSSLCGGVARGERTPACTGEMLAAGKLALRGRGVCLNVCGSAAGVRCGGRHNGPREPRRVEDALALLWKPIDANRAAELRAAVAGYDRPLGNRRRGGLAPLTLEWLVLVVGGGLLGVVPRRLGGRLGTGLVVGSAVTGRQHVEEQVAVCVGCTEQVCPQEVQTRGGRELESETRHTHKHRRPPRGPPNLLSFAVVTEWPVGVYPPRRYRYRYR